MWACEGCTFLGEKDTLRVCVSTKIHPLSPKPVLFSSWQTTSCCRCVCRDSRWTLGYIAQPKENTRNSSFLTELLPAFILTTEVLTLLTKKSAARFSPSAAVPDLPNWRQKHLKHQCGDGNNRRNVRVAHTHFRHSSWFLLQSKWGEVVSAEALSNSTLLQRGKYLQDFYLNPHRNKVVPG